MLPTHRVTQGDAFYLKVPLLLDGVAQPVAGWRLRFSVKAAPGDVSPLIALDTADGSIAGHDATAWRVEAPAAATKDLAPGRYYYDLQADDPAGRIYTLERGYLTIDPEITH